MKVIADVCVIPMGIGVSVSKEVTVCERILADAGLKTKLHAYGTNVEGEWDAVFNAVKKCHETLHQMGVPASQPACASALASIASRPWTTKCAVSRRN